MTVRELLEVYRLDDQKIGIYENKKMLAMFSDKKEAINVYGNCKVKTFKFSWQHVLLSYVCLDISITRKEDMRGD